MEGNRHGTLVTAIGLCVRAGFSNEDIQHLMLPVIDAKWAVGGGHADLDRILIWTREQQAAELAATPAVPSHIAAAFTAGSAR